MHGNMAACLTGAAEVYIFTMEIIESKRFGEERALYAKNGLQLINCRFEGPEDGESAVKECRNILLDNCYCDLRYPFWHCNGITLRNCTATENCRAALWYDDSVTIENCAMNGIKAVRECRNVNITGSGIVSPEFGWRSRGIRVGNTSIDSQYAFFEAGDITADGMTLTGKYTFQYVDNVYITNSRLDTKDAFWHSRNVTVKDSLVKGEYLAWYSDGLTLINCHIVGTQPLCYCKNLTLINCTTEGCDLAFEYSSVNAEIKGGILSVKNPLSGEIRADEIGEMIATDDSVYPVNARVYAGGHILWPNILRLRK